MHVLGVPADHFQLQLLAGSAEHGMQFKHNYLLGERMALACAHSS
jgi:hypothetical protein